MTTAVLNNKKPIISGIPNWLFVFTFAIAINSIMAYVLLNFFEVDTHPDYYHTLAQNLMSGNGYIVEPGKDPIFWRPPLYPLMLAAVYYIFGIHHLPVVIVQILINSLSSVLLYLVIKKIFGATAGICAAIVYALYPLSGYYVVRELPLILFNFLIILLIFIMYRLYETPTWINALMFGAVQGLLTLTQVFFKGFPVFIILSVLLISMFHFYHFARAQFLPPGLQKGGESLSLFNIFSIYINQSKMQIKKYLLITIMMFLGFSIILMPWLIRNYKVSGIFPVVGVGGGFTLWFGNNIQTDGKDFDQLPPEQAEALKMEMRQIIGNNGYGVDLKNDKKLYDEAINNFIRYPKETAILMFKKIFRLWFWVYSLSMQKYQRFVTILQFMIILPGILGIFLALKNRIRVGPLLLLLAYFQMVYTIYTGTIRYSIPVMPVVIGFAVYGVIEVYRKFSVYHWNRARA